MAYYDEYFDLQTGGARTGYGGISQVYIGSPYQRGHGIGSFLGGLFRRIIPLLKQGARAVGKEALRSGINAATDIMDAGVHPREAFKTRLRESGQNLKRKAEEKIYTLMQGSGYKATKINKLMHSLTDRSSHRIARNNKTATSRKRATLKRGRGVKKKTASSRSRRVKRKSVKRKKTSSKTRKKARTVSDIFA